MSSRIAFLTGTLSCLIIASFSGTTTCCGQDLTLSGTVRLTDNSELKGALVRVSRGGSEITRTKTGDKQDKGDGYYELKVKKHAAGQPLLLRVDPPNLNTHVSVVITQLSDQDRQNISVIVFDRMRLVAIVMSAAAGEKVDVTPLVTQYNTLETIYFMELNTGTKPDALREQYGHMIGAIAPALKPVPQAPAASKAALQKGYEIRRMFAIDPR